MLVLAHTGGAAALDLPPWGLAYGAAAIVLLVTAAWRARFVVDAARNGGDPAADTRAAGVDSGPGRGARGRPGRTALAAAGRALGVGGLGLVVAAALLGPTASAANLAPSAVLVVWWVGLPLACAVAGDVMGWLDPFGTLARGASRVVGRCTRAPAAASPTLLAVTAAASLAAFTWWSLAFHDGRSPRALGWFLAAYAVVATAAAVAWGPPWPRRGEGFGAVSSGLAAARRRHPGARQPPTLVVAAVVAVWLGGLAFDLFSGTRAWVDLAGATSGWARTGRATACLAVAVAAAGLAVGATIRWARGGAQSADRGATTTPTADGRNEADDRNGGAGADRDDPRQLVGRALGLAWLATTAGAVVAHGLTLLLVDGQFALALVSDPFGRGWDLFGTADRAIDYSPWTPGVVGTAQIVLVTAGAVWGVSATGRILAAARREGLGARAAIRALWVAGLAGAVTAAAVVAALATDLE